MNIYNIILIFVIDLQAGSDRNRLHFRPSVSMYLCFYALHHYVHMSVRLMLESLFKVGKNPFC